ncbi:AAA family ATPase [Glycomyces sp. NRRL B-16210]|uniref:AAA family ATPase n=1 Tax=Glycomyces sp. NRRL B-16210 TaxID=1463821 RepID=UPI0005588F38|nr:AAA family ATPase [Glycomyces sp. NRRL B-16210]
MRIEHVRIRNFRCIEDVAVVFEPDMTAFIGSNNAGKSTILRALHWFFNGQPTELDHADRHSGAREHEPIEVEVTFRALTDDDREAFGEDFDLKDTESVTVRRSWTDGEDAMAVRRESVPEFTAIRNLTTLKARREAYAKLREDRPELQLPIAGPEAAVKAAMAAWEAAHPERLRDEYFSVKPLFGFNSRNRFSGLFDYVFVSADLRASEEAANGRKTLLTQLLNRCVDLSEAEIESEAYALEAAAKREEIFRRRAGARMAEIQYAMTEVIAGYLPECEARLDFRCDPPREVRPSVEMFLSEAGGDIPIHLQGHGAQRAALIALVLFLASEVARTGIGGSLVLAIEEPELSQHRSQERVFACRFRQLAADLGSQTQVVLVTHSPNFIDPEQFHQLRRVVSEPAVKGGRRIVGVRSAGAFAVSDQGPLKEHSIRKALGKMNPGELSEALFEKAAVVVEGVTEKAILRGITSRPGQRPFDDDGIAVVIGGSKTGLLAPYALLRALGIPALIVFDTDGARLGGDGVLAAPNGAASGQTLRLLQYFGVPETDFAIGEGAPGLYALEGKLETALDRDWPKWEHTRATVVREGRGASGKDFIAYEIAARECPSDPTGQLAEIVELARKLR